MATLYVDASRTSIGGATRLWFDPVYFSIEEIDSEIEKGEIDKLKEGRVIDTEDAFSWI